MYGIFVNNDGPVPYADKIVDRIKPIETRSRNMLGRLMGDEPVYVIATGKGKQPMVIGYAWITCYWKWSAELMDDFRHRTLIPKGSKYDTGARWCYLMSYAQRITPFPLPAEAVRHGRSWCEF